MLNVEAIEKAEAVSEPFSFFRTVVLSEPDLAKVRADFPAIDKPGIFPPEALKFGAAFGDLVEELQSPSFSRAVGAKLGIELAELPQMITVRGRAQAKDGRIHTDTKDKVATCLLYLNSAWDGSGGRLRLLRNGHDLEDYIAEIPPSGGTLVAFKVAHNSWHGHRPYVGERRYVMVNWVRSEAAQTRQLRRHRLSAEVKRLVPFFYRGQPQ